MKCKDCKHRKYCFESSREYPCREFKEKREEVIMKIPKEIAEKVFEYESHKKKADSLFEEIEKWFEGNVCDGCCQNDYSITTKPEGISKGDGKYCRQRQYGICEDSFEGTYYYPIEDCDSFPTDEDVTHYVAIDYIC